MRKITVFTSMILLLMVCSVSGMTGQNNTEKPNTTFSDDLETRLEREMLTNISYVEDDEEIDLGFDPYFYLPHGFNPYDGMELDLNDIQYIENEEYEFTR